MFEDDELAYSASTVRKGLQPVTTMRFLHIVPAEFEKSLKFEKRVRSMFCLGVVDSGATHSIVSLKFCRQNSLKFTRVNSQALFADGKTHLPVVGVMWKAPVQVQRFNCLQAFLVLDFSACDVLLGMDWLRAQNPELDFRYRLMTLRVAKGPITVHAVPTDPGPACSSSCIEVCTIDAFAKSLRDKSVVDGANIVVAVLQHTPPAPRSLSGPGATN
jgi:hypothetical protein